MEHELKEFIRECDEAIKHIKRRFGFPNRLFCYAVFTLLLLIFQHQHFCYPFF